MDGNVSVKAIHEGNNSILALISRCIRTVDDVWAINAVADNERLLNPTRCFFNEFSVGSRECSLVECMRVDQYCRGLVADLVQLDSCDKVRLSAQRSNECCEKLVASSPRCLVEHVPN